MKEFVEQFETYLKPIRKTDKRKELFLKIKKFLKVNSEFSDLNNLEGYYTILSNLSEKKREITQSDFLTMFYLFLNNTNKKNFKIKDEESLGEHPSSSEESFDNPLALYTLKSKTLKICSIVNLLY